MTTVTLYTKPRCEQCRASKRRLTEAGVEFHTRDLTAPANADFLATAIEAGHQSAPIVHYELDDGTGGIWSGYRPDLIDALAKRIGADQ